jgi:hypothetical protein
MIRRLIPHSTSQIIHLSQRFSRVLYQHSLLSMAELHYNQGEHRAARHVRLDKIFIPRRTLAQLFHVLVPR